MSVSYANVAASPQGSTTDPSEEPVTVSGSSSGSPKISSSASEDIESPSAPPKEGSTEAATIAAPSSSETSSSAASASAPATKPKKVLTPAPVPSKSVWGTTSTVQKTNVDEHKWPTPHQSSATEQSPQNPTKLAASKAVKGSKWVPINAKVVLPSPRSTHANGAGSQLKTKRKNKNTRKSKSASAPASAYDESKKDEIVSKDEESNEDGNSTSAPQGVSEQVQDGNDASTGDQQHQQQNFNDNKQRFNPQQKNYRRHNQNGAPQGNSSGRPHGQQQRPQGVYYQQFVPSQYQGNNRQFRSMNGGNVPYNRSNSNGNILAANHYGMQNAFRPMGNGPFVPLPQHPQPMMVPGMPFGIAPVHIPPPISPKQNPEQALTLQIDYYFSSDNLVRDVYLRRNMGTEGWIELDLILNFKRVKIIVNSLKNSIEETDEQIKEEKLDKAILHAVQRCQNLDIGYLNGKEHDDAKATEVQLRVRNSFEKWILPDN